MPDPRIKRIPDLVPTTGRTAADHFRANLALLGAGPRPGQFRPLEGLAQFATLRFIPSFLLRALNDFLNKRPNTLSGMQQSIIAAWTKAGLTRRTLAYWAWRLKRETTGTRSGRAQRRTRSVRAAVQDRSFVELIVDRQQDARFLLELGDGRRLRIPAAFDADALKRLLTALREAP